ncbi:MAG: tetratricopeptide repeat protein [Candidatus Obscuribacterales bacterium]|nr:tetratricopeptide repeat protein [Candidatus Obscuribacterales bacterium]
MDLGEQRNESFERGVLLFDAGRWSEAERVFRDALIEEPESASCHAMRALCLLNLGDVAAAKWPSDEAVRIEPDNAYVHFVRAALIAHECAERSVFLVFHRFYEAEKAIETAIQLDPENAAYHEMAASIAFEFLRPRRCLKRLEKSIELDSQSASAWALRAQASMALGKHAAALHCADEALRLDPQCADFHKIRGQILRKQKNLIGALSHFGEALNLDSAGKGASIADEIHQTTENHNFLKDIVQPCVSSRLKELASRTDPERVLDGILEQSRADYIAAIVILVSFGGSCVLSCCGAFEASAPGLSGTLAALSGFMAMVGACWLATIAATRVKWDEDGFCARDVYGRVKEVRWRQLMHLEYDSEHFVLVTLDGRKYKIRTSLLGWGSFAQKLMRVLEENAALPVPVGDGTVKKLDVNVDFGDEDVFVAEFPVTFVESNRFCIIGLIVLLTIWVAVALTSSKEDLASKCVVFGPIGFFSILLCIALALAHYEARLRVFWSNSRIVGGDFAGRRHQFLWSEITSVQRLPRDGLKVVATGGRSIVLYPRMANFRAFSLRLARELRNRNVV